MENVYVGAFPRCLTEALNICELIVVPELVDAGVMPKLRALFKEQPDATDTLLEIWATALGVPADKVVIWVRLMRENRLAATHVRKGSGWHPIDSHLPTPTSAEPSPASLLPPVESKWPVAESSISEEPSMTYLKQELILSPDTSVDEMDELEEEESPSPTQYCQPVKTAELLVQQPAIASIAPLQALPDPPLPTASSASNTCRRLSADEQSTLAHAVMEAFSQPADPSLLGDKFWAVVEQVTQDCQTAINLLQANQTETGNQ